MRHHHFNIRKYFNLFIMDKTFIKVTEKQINFYVFNKWRKEQSEKCKDIYFEPIEYRIADTSLGTVVKVYHHVTKSEIDITNYDCW